MLETPKKETEGVGEFHSILRTAAILRVFKLQISSMRAADLAAAMLLMCFVAAAADGDVAAVSTSTRRSLSAAELTEAHRSSQNEIAS